MPQPIRIKDHEKDALILVGKIQKSTASMDAALKAAQDHIQVAKKELHESYEIEKLEPTAGDELPPQVGTHKGKIVELKMKSDDKSYQKYILLAVVQRPKHFYFIQCESFWHYRQSWRGDFLDIVSTFTLGKD